MNKAVKAYGADILGSDRFLKAYRVKHHLKHNVAEHSLRVAESGYRMARWLNEHGIDVSCEDVVRGGLLHDIGMTERGVHESASYKKAFLHPQSSGDIAGAEYCANDVQLDAIRRHMWPICVIPPKHLAGWVIVAADKYSSVKEFLI